MASSKTAHRKRRRAAALRKYKRLRRQGRLPVHTPTERKRTAKERERWYQAERKKLQRIKEVAGVAVTPVAAAAVFTFVPTEHIPLEKLYKTHVATEATWRPELDKPDDPHTELLDVMLPDPFIPAAGTASATPSYGPSPSGGVNPHWDGWERYHWNFYGD